MSKIDQYPDVGSDISPAELRWLCNQTRPVWGAHIERGVPVEQTALWPLVRDGIIERWDTEWRKGYRATKHAKSMALTQPL